ncbi:MAG: lmo0937 family membrane protein [Nitrospirota bacterium]
MWWTSAVTLMMVWLLGVVSHYTMGGLIHVLLMVALITAAVSLMRSRRLA